MRKTHFFPEIALIFWSVFRLVFEKSPFFLKTKKNRSEIASSFPAVARLDLSHVSENKGFGNSQTPTFGGRRRRRRRRRRKNLLAASSPLSHHAQGFNIPFGHTPHSDQPPGYLVYLFWTHFGSIFDPKIPKPRRVEKLAGRPIGGWKIGHS